MKRIFVILLLVLTINCFAQVSNHSYFIGGNVSGINLDLSTSGIAGLTHKDFSNAKPGFDFGYRYLFSLSAKATIGAGLEFKNINSSFSRPYYNYPFNPNPNLAPVNENLKFYRLAVPIQGYYSFINKKNYSIYFSAGADFILVNSLKRSANYQLPGPPTGYIGYTFKGTQTVKFNNNSSLGFALFAGLGYEFVVKENTFYIEVSYDSDISKNKILTLHNIELDSYYSAKMKNFQLKAGHIFSLKRKAK